MRDWWRRNLAETGVPWWAPIVGVLVVAAVAVGAVVDSTEDNDGEEVVTSEASVTTTTEATDTTTVESTTTATSLPTTTTTLAVPTPPCVAAFRAVAEVDLEDAAAYDRAYLATTELCASYDDWITTLHEYPETIGYRPDATPEQLENEIYLVCIPVTDTPVCRDAERMGLLG